jgi:hypothetical protein
VILVSWILARQAAKYWHIRHLAARLPVDEEHPARMCRHVDDRFWFDDGTAAISAPLIIYGQTSSAISMTRLKKPSRSTAYVHRG